MTVALGPRSLIDLALPSGVDFSEILRLETREGMTAQEVIQMAATVIGEANQEIENRYAGLFTNTVRNWTKLRQGDGERTMTPLGSEFSDPDGVRGQRVGHMLFMQEYKDAMEWSVAYLREAYRDDLIDDAMTIKDRWINRCDYEFIWRMLRPDEVLVGTTGYAPGWAIGTGTNTNYVPPQWMTYQHTTAHTHYLRFNLALNATNLATALNGMAKELAHHGHGGDKVAFFSEDDMAIVNGMVVDVKFAKFLPPGFRNPGAVSGTPVSIVPGTLQGIPGEVIGYFASDYGLVELRYHPRIPTTYVWMGKSYGQNNPNNPLALKTDPLIGGFGLAVNPQVDRSITPKLEKLLFEAKHGVNVNNRTAGVAAQIATGGTTYDTPTIS